MKHGIYFHRRFKANNCSIPGTHILSTDCDLTGQPHYAKGTMFMIMRLNVRQEELKTLKVPHVKDETTVLTTCGESWDSQTHYR